MIYNGTSCNATGTNAQVGTSQFSTTRDDNTDVGYMYGTRGATTYADTVKNTNNSTIKTYVDNWYKSHMTNYTSYLGDELFCNDRSTTGKGYGKNETYYGANNRRYGNLRNATSSADLTSLYNTITLKCPQKNDAFTVSDTTKGNGALTYPVGLITMDEMVLAGGGTAFEQWSEKYYRVNRNYYLYTGQTYWGLSPYALIRSNIYVFHVHSVGHIGYGWTTNADGVRPVINLKSTVNVRNSKNSGTIDNPYQVIVK